MMINFNLRRLVSRFSPQKTLVKNNMFFSSTSTTSTTAATTTTETKAHKKSKVHTRIRKPIDVTVPRYPAFNGFDGTKIVLITSELKLSDAINDIASNTVIGFDSKTKPTFEKGAVCQGPNLVQLSTMDKAYLFPISIQEKVDVDNIKTYLKTVLESKNVIKVGFGLGDDINLLKANHDIDVQNSVDMGKKLRTGGSKNFVSARSGVASVLQQDFYKNPFHAKSNWLKPAKLYTKDQKLYAANDAFVGLKVYSEWIKTQQPQKRKKVKSVKADTVVLSEQSGDQIVTPTETEASTSNSSTNLIM